ncbi:Nucleolar protein of 40 kDa [Mortierella alpina]|nr:Nucleolar protein of 40 kDa [Mortierella alpina]
MTDAISITSRKLAGMDRLQLQAACTKLGLDSTAQTEELRLLLQEHCNQQGQSQQGSTGAGVVRGEKTGLPELHSTQESNEVAIKEETADGTQAIEDELRIKEEAVEDSAVAAALDPLLAKTEQADVVVKEEEGCAQVKEEDGTENKEAEDKVIKHEDDAHMDVDTKIEDTTVPVIQRKQFWESRTSSTRSTLPVSKARVTGRLAPVGSRNESTRTTSKPGMQKRERPAEDMETDADVKEEADQGNALPTPGTVRNLIGKFAGSAISPPGSPVSKRRRVEISKSPRPTTATSAPSIPKYKKVIKIPTAGSAKTKSAYATGATRATTGTRQRKTAESNANPVDNASTSPALSSSTSKRSSAVKAVSAETINRLATPKKVSTAPAAVLPGYKKHGLVHKTQASKHFTENIADVVAIGDHVWVKVTSLQDDKIALSMKYVSQGSGEDLDPNLVQLTGAEDKRRVHGGFMDKAPISIEQGGVLLKTVCKKCGAAGHLAAECFSGGEKFELLGDEDDGADEQAPQSGRPRSSDKKKKEKESRDKNRDKDRGRDRESGRRDHKEMRESRSHKKESRRHGRSRRIRGQGFSEEANTGNSTRMNPAPVQADERRSHEDPKWRV